MRNNFFITHFSFLQFFIIKSSLKHYSGDIESNFKKLVLIITLPSIIHKKCFGIK